jgi:hypothetical protein
MAVEWVAVTESTVTWTAGSDATTATHSAVTEGRVDSWYQFSAVSATAITGINFQIAASEQYPVRVNTNDPLRVIGSNYSTGRP